MKENGYVCKRGRLLLTRRSETQLFHSRETLRRTGVGGITAYWKGGSFRIENDVFALSGDRWRTNAWELTFGDFSIGSYIYTNDGQAKSEEMEELIGTNIKDPSTNCLPSRRGWIGCHTGISSSSGNFYLV